MDKICTGIAGPLPERNSGKNKLPIGTPKSDVSSANISSLIERIKKEDIKEIILALKPSIEGETTSLYISKLLEKENVNNINIPHLHYGIEIIFDENMIIGKVISFNSIPITPQGTLLGVLQNDGTVENEKKQVVGRYLPDGTVRDASGKVIAKMVRAGMVVGYGCNDIGYLDKDGKKVDSTTITEEKDILRKYYGRFGGYWRFPKMLDYCYLVNPYFRSSKIIDEMQANPQMEQNPAYK